MKNHSPYLNLTLNGITVPFFLTNRSGLRERTIPTPVPRSERRMSERMRTGGGNCAQFSALGKGMYAGANQSLLRNMGRGTASNFLKICYP